MGKQYNVGDTFKDKNRNYTIINKIIDREKSRTLYKYKCNVCGYTCDGGYRNGNYVENTYFTSSQIIRGDKCSCCSGKIVSPNINSVFSTRKDLVKYFKNIDDSKKYSENANVSIELVCPDCGTEKTMLLPNFTRRGFSCSKCSDKLPIGEKSFIVC